ncbi:MAG: hypothetical protein ACJ8F1_03695 [Polyangia bacterium]
MREVVLGVGHELSFSESCSKKFARDLLRGSLPEKRKAGGSKVRTSSKRGIGDYPEIRIDQVLT